MGFHVHIPLESLSVDDALLYLRARLYDGDRKAIAAMFYKRPDLGRADLITDYVWTHLGQALLAPLLEGRPPSAIEASILEWIPAAEGPLGAICEDTDTPAAAAEAAGRILARLRGHAGMTDKENDMSDYDELDDLFGPSDEGDEEAGGKRRLPLTPVEGAPRSQIVEFAGNDISLAVSEENDATQLHINGTLMNLLPTHVEVNELQLVLRAEGGALLDTVSHYMNSRFNRAQEIVAELHCGPGLVSEVRQVDVRAVFNYEFRSRLASGQVGEVRSGGQYFRERWEVELEHHETPPGLPSFDVDVACFYGAQYDEVCDFVVEMTDLTPSTDQSREVVVALRDKGGKVVAKESHWGTFPAGAPLVFKVTPYLDGVKLKAIDRVDVAVKGNCRKNELIGSFAVDQG